jgi:ABC-type bacteriocin/lantibiotic exporter with double-glycine peptidase domain
MNAIQYFSSFAQRISRQPPFPIVIQSDETECGLASLSMVLRAMGISSQLEDLRSRYGSTRGGMTIGELCRFAATVGLRGIPARTQASEIPITPVILFVRGEHFSVLWKIDKKLYYVADPSDGNLVFSIEDFNKYYSGIIISFRQIKSTFAKERLRPISRTSINLSKLLIDRSTIVTVIIILAIISSVLTLFNAAAQDVFMTYIVEEGEILWTKALVIATVVCSILIAVSGYMMQIAVQRQLQHVIQEWNIDLFASLFRAPYSFFINKSSGLIASRFNQVEEALAGYQSAVLAAFTGMLNLFIYVIVVSLVSLPLAIVSSLGIFGFLAIGIRFYGFNIQNNYLIREAECESATAEFKLFNGRRQIILEHADKAIQRELTGAYTSLIKAELDIQRIGVINEFFLGNMDQLLNVSLLVVSAILIIDGRLTTGTYAAVNVIVGTALQPVRSLSTLVETFQNSRLTFQSASELYQHLPGEDSHSDAQQPSYAEPLIELADLSFHYSIYSDPVFQNTNLRVKSKSNQPLAVRLDGSSGSGKSTLLNLLMGLVLPSSGYVRVLGIDIGSLSVEQARQIVQYVDRNALITKGSVEMNARLGTRADYNQFEECVSTLGFSKQPIFCQQHARFLHDDSSLSIGQAVMISLVRAALYRPSLLLIDESLISLPQDLHKGVVTGLLSLGINVLVVQHGESDYIGSLPTVTMSSLQKDLIKQ